MYELAILILIVKEIFNPVNLLICFAAGFMVRSRKEAFAVSLPLAAAKLLLFIHFDVEMAEDAGLGLRVPYIPTLAATILGIVAVYETRHWIKHINRPRGPF